MKTATFYYTRQSIQIPGVATDCNLYEDCVLYSCEEVGILVKVINGIGSNKAPTGMESEFYDALDHALDMYMEETEEF